MNFKLIRENIVIYEFEYDEVGYGITDNSVFFCKFGSPDYIPITLFDFEEYLLEYMKDNTGETTKVPVFFFWNKYVQKEGYFNNAFKFHFKK